MIKIIMKNNFICESKLRYARLKRNRKREELDFVFQ